MLLLLLLLLLLLSMESINGRETFFVM